MSNSTHKLNIGYRSFKMEVFFPSGDTNKTVVIPHSRINDTSISDDNVYKNTYKYKYKVYWGDGNSGTVTQWRDINAKHTYAGYGTYEIKIVGRCETFDNISFFTNGLASTTITGGTYSDNYSGALFNFPLQKYITKITQFGDILPKVFNLANCVKLVEVVNDTDSFNRLGTDCFDNFFLVFIFFISGYLSATNTSTISSHNFLFLKFVFIS